MLLASVWGEVWRFDYFTIIGWGCIWGSCNQSVAKHDGNLGARNFSSPFCKPICLKKRSCFWTWIWNWMINVYISIVSLHLHEVASYRHVVANSMWENWRKIIQHTTHKNPSFLSLMDILLLKWLVLLLDQRPPNMGHMAICRKHTRLELDAKWPSRFSRWPSLKYWQSGSKARKALHIFTQDVQENLLTADLSDVFLLYRLYIYIYESTSAAWR